MSALLFFLFLSEFILCSAQQALDICVVQRNDKDTYQYAHTGIRQHCVVFIREDSLVEKILVDESENRIRYRCEYGTYGNVLGQR